MYSLSFTLYKVEIRAGQPNLWCGASSSWWWTEELSETCRVLFWKWNWVISASGWFYHKNFIMMHSHMNVKFVDAKQQRKHISIGTPQKNCSKPTWQYGMSKYAEIWHITWLCVEWKTPDDGQRNCPKHVEFYSKNKFEKLVASSWFYYEKLQQNVVCQQATWNSVHTAKNKLVICTIICITLPMYSVIHRAITIYRY